jgi:hypothetical protein
MSTFRDIVSTINVGALCTFIVSIAFSAFWPGFIAFMVMCLTAPMLNRP